MSRLFATTMGLFAAAVVACATGTTESGSDDDDEPGGSGVGAGGSTTTTTTTSTTDTTSTTSDTGGSSPECGPTQHLCGGVCADNTPQTGCYGSTSCSPCAAVPNGTTICTSQGTCDFTCISPYQKSGNSCVCPNECCTASDCDTDGTCENGSCVYPCDLPSCILECMLQGYAGGICMPDCMCVN